MTQLEPMIILPLSYQGDGEVITVGDDAEEEVEGDASEPI